MGVGKIITRGFGAGVRFVPTHGFTPAVVVAPAANVIWHAAARGVVFLAPPRPVVWTAPARPQTLAAPERR